MRRTIWDRGLAGGHLGVVCDGDVEVDRRGGGGGGGGARRRRK